MELIIVTGLSGAGKSGAVNALEDIDYYCIDNMPPKLMPKLLELSATTHKYEKIAVVMDIRGGDIFTDMFDVIDELEKSGYKYRILFLDADNNTIIRRYKQTRRKHPLVSNGYTMDSVTVAIAEERRILEQIRQKANYIIDTSMLSPAQLKRKVQDIFSESKHDSLLVSCMSFGFKYGLPSDADLVFDVRCLPNPYYVPELKHKTGLEQEIIDYVMNSEDSEKLKEKLISLLDFLMPLYHKEGKSQIVVAIGCTGGMHRSVVICEIIKNHFENIGYNTIVTHRDMIRSSNQ